MLGKLKIRTGVLTVLSLLLGAAVFLKNAWVSEDAYIVFRSLEQLFAGNGPVWNPHERVQVFTSPLWYILQTIPRIISSDVFLNTIFLSLVLWISIIFILKHLYGDNDKNLFLTILFFSASSAFFDFTSSGLENILAYFIITSYLFYFFRLWQHSEKSKSHEHTDESVRSCIILFGLLILVRHDLVLLLLLPTSHIIYTNPPKYSLKQWVGLILLSLSPFIVFSLFSLLYYGFPLPNTAYAKLNTGIDITDLIRQGLFYLGATLKNDLITILMILGALLYIFWEKEWHYKTIGFGIILYLVYVVYIGGDFMQGRFLSYSFLISTVFMLFSLEIKWSDWKIKTILILLSAYLIVYPHTPLTSRNHYYNNKLYEGIADERGYYFHKLSLYKYLTRFRDGKIFPNMLHQETGEEFKVSSDDLIIKDDVGVFGYYSGIEKIIIDPNAITDPFLCRLPVTDKWRIGHFRREIPDGYIDVVSNLTNDLTDPEINQLYGRIRLITRSSNLYSRDRLAEILLVNLGY